MKVDKTIFGKKFWSKIAGIFTEKPLPDQMYQNFQEMMTLAQSMYISVTSVLLDPDVQTLEHIRESFYLTDRKINLLETMIRREILVHLSVSGGTAPNTATYLTLLNLVKNGERIGDYNKNLFEVFEHSANAISGQYLEKFRMVRDETVLLFSEVHTAISTLDPKMGIRSCQSIRPLIKECGMVVDEMLIKPESSPNPVAVALLFRYQKRILNHLAKVAMAQFAPFDKYGECTKGTD